MGDLAAMLELLKDQQDLQELGLTEDEIQGYLEFYWDRYNFQTIGVG